MAIVFPSIVLYTFRCILDAKFFKFRRERFAEVNRVVAINIAARSFLSRKTVPMLSVSTLIVRSTSACILKHVCVYIYTRCLVYYKLYLPLATASFHQTILPR